MNYFSNLKIRTRLYLLISFIFIMMLGIIGLMKMDSEKAHETSRAFDKNYLAPIVIIDRILFLMGANKSHAASMVLHDPETAISKKQGHEVSVHIEGIKKNRDEINRLATEYLKHNLSEEEKVMFDEWTVIRKRYVLEGLNPIIGAVEKSDYTMVMDLYLTKVNPLYKEGSAQAINLSENLVKWAKKDLQQSEELYLLIKKVGIGLLAMVSVISVFLSIFIIRSIISEVKVIEENLEALIRNKNFTIEIKVKPTEIGRVSAKLKEFVENMRIIFVDVKDNAEMVSTASGQIAAGNLDLSGRTEEQASSLEQIAATMDELTSTVQHNAENTRQTNQLAVNASAIAEEGGSSIDLVTETMEKISTSSKKIVDIISVIEGIAFQTNILALNAAVEAARAGEQGRGFAVVATEVRSLAQRSSVAAKEIKNLIDDSVAKVKIGNEQVERAGDTMGDIMKAVKQVAAIMSEMTVASHEQTSGIEQVSQAITQMDQMTQQNAALVEEAAAATGSLEEQAIKLKGMIGAFVTDTKETKKGGT